MQIERFSQPATRDSPRYLTWEHIDAFEKANPSLAGIGRIMVERGVWVVVDDLSEMTT
ncbi:MAG: hypothetical protein ACP5C4_07435 [Methanomicrobiales archaeon]